MRYLIITTKWLASVALILAISALSLQPVLATAAPAMPQSPWGAQLSNEEAAGLIFMVEEEKLAHDLYLALNEQWPMRIFSNIAAAEQTHMDAVRGLLEVYGLNDPTLGQPAGVFQDQNLQALYDDLLAAGSASLAAALQAGITVEEADIADLDERLAQTDEPAIAQVYTHLRTGSTHHLNAFTRTLQRWAGTGD